VKTIPGVPKDFSAAQKRRAVTHIGKDQNRFDVAIAEFFKGPYRYNQKVAGALFDVLRKHPYMLAPHIKRFLLQLISPATTPQ
jgi:hypothetical protein